MSFIARRALATSARRAFTTSTRRPAQVDPGLKKESEQNPELWILGIVMVSALGGAGYYFGASPTTSTSESPVSKAGMPWETGSGEGKYKYHPGGDPNAPARDAPSALNTSIVPDVNLPKHLHDAFNKFGKE